MKLSQLFLQQDTLASQITRSFIGERNFTDIANSFLPNANQNQGILAKFGNFLLNGLNFIGWSIGSVLQWLIPKTIELIYFDWKQSKQEISDSIQTNNQLIGQQWGMLTGKGLVWLVSIGTAAGLSAKFPVIAGRMALTLAEEGGQDLAGQLFSTLGITAETVIDNIALFIYGESRSFIKSLLPQGSEKKKHKTAWKESQKQNIVPGTQLLRGFLRGLGEGAIDALYDVAYTISFSIDDHFAAAREATNPRTNEPERTIEVFVDDVNGSQESLRLTGTQEEVIRQTESYLATHQLVENRDLGVIVGQPYQDWYGLKPQARKLIIEFRDKEKPPFKDAKKGQTFRVQISIPDAKRGLDWNDLKTKILKYTWGNSWAKVIFDNRRFMTVWGATEKEAEQQAKLLSQLSTLTIIQISTGTVVTQDLRKKKKPTLVYPCFAQLLVRETVVNPNNSVTIDGKNRNMAKERYPIWKEEKPSNFKPLP
jgi:hypothetical protein